MHGIQLNVRNLNINTPFYLLRDTDISTFTSRRYLRHGRESLPHQLRPIPQLEPRGLCRLRHRLLARLLILRW